MSNFKKVISNIKELKSCNKTLECFANEIEDMEQYNIVKNILNEFEYAIEELENNIDDITYKLSEIY